MLNPKDLKNMIKNSYVIYIEDQDDEDYGTVMSISEKNIKIEMEDGRIKTISWNVIEGGWLDEGTFTLRSIYWKK